MIRLFLVGVGLIALAVTLTFVTTRDAAAQTSCGPGAHWVDTCAAGVDGFPQTAADVGIDVDGDCAVDQTFGLTGPVQVNRSNPVDDSVNFPGTRPIDSHNDVIDTEITQMSLTGGGITLRVGVGTPGINGGVPNSFGVIAEQPGDPLVADSFFDVFFEVELPGPNFLYNHAPVRVTADPPIDRVPPQASYVHGPAPLCLDLFDDPAAGSDTGLNLIEAVHETKAPVGGIAELPGEESAAPLEAGESSGGSIGALAGLAAGAAAGLVALTGAAWYVRRRVAR